MIKLLPQTAAYGGRLKDREALRASSSGGAFTAISDVFLNRGDAVVCCVYDFEAGRQEYVIAETAAERDKARGSKYVQSIPGDIFRAAENWLDSHPGHGLLFVGMGCQAAGFLKYAEMKGLRGRVTVVDIICHGSPSPKLWKEYAESLQKSCGRADALTFKDKRHGWNRPTAVLTAGGKEISLKEYVKAFNRNYMLRPSCYQCPYAATERKTDLTIGDFWHIEERIPSFYDKLGTSLFLIHTERGAEVFEEARQALDWVETNTGECLQLNLEKPTERPSGRDEFWRDYKTKGAAYVIGRYGHESGTVRLKKAVKKTLRKLSGGK